MTRFLQLLAVAFGVALLLAFGAGCATSGDTVTLRRLPTWVAPADAHPITQFEVAVQVQSHAPGAILDTPDSTFTPVAHEWLVATVRWAWDTKKQLNLATFSSESWDCDDFAREFSRLANKAAARAGVRAQPLVAVIEVRQEREFGGVPAGGLHALNAFYSDRGLFVYEPQTETLVPLAEYPNRSTIYKVRIGG